MGMQFLATAFFIKFMLLIISTLDHYSKKVSIGLCCEEEKMNIAGSLDWPIIEWVHIQAKGILFKKTLDYECSYL